MVPAESLARLRKHVLDRVTRGEVTVLAACRAAGLSRARSYQLRRRRVRLLDDNRRQGLRATFTATPTAEGEQGRLTAHSCPRSPQRNRTRRTMTDNGARYVVGLLIPWSEVRILPPEHGGLSYGLITALALPRLLRWPNHPPERAVMAGR